MCLALFGGEGEAGLACMWGLAWVVLGAEGRQHPYQNTVHPNSLLWVNLSLTIYDELVYINKYL